jgi:hypothetical protein
MGRIKGVKNGSGGIRVGGVCKLERSRKMERIRKGLQAPDEYTMTAKEAWEKAGLVWTIND